MEMVRISNNPDDEVSASYYESLLLKIVLRWCLCLTLLSYSVQILQSHITHVEFYIHLLWFRRNPQTKRGKKPNPGEKSKQREWIKKKILVSIFCSFEYKLTSEATLRKILQLFAHNFFENLMHSLIRVRDHWIERCSLQSPSISQDVTC